jgi:hypothetical protein
VHWNIEDGYEEPWSTGQGPYRTRTDAVTEAKEWAQGWGIEVRIPDMKPGEKEEADGLLTTLKSIGLDVTVLDRNPAN